MSKAARTRQYIIEQTAPIFNKKGYKGTSMADITEATNLTKGAIYGNFTDKDKLAAAVIEYNIHRLNDKILCFSTDDKSVRTKLFNILTNYRKIAQEVLNYGGCAYLNSAVETDDTNDFLFTLVQQKFTGWQTFIHTLITEGITNEEIKPDTDKVGFTNFFIALVEGSILLAKTFDDVSIIDSNLNTLETFIDAIFVNEKI